MRIAIFGTGYVGLVTGTCLADTGVRVTCVDKDDEIIETLNRGESTIYEPGLEEMLRKNIQAGKIDFTTRPEDPIRESDIIIITVGTPSHQNGEANLDYVFEVSRTIGENINGYKLIVQKSTVPVGTCRQIEEVIRQELTDRDNLLDFSVASNPEFLKEGTAVDDFLKPARIILGVEDDRAKGLLKNLYKPFMRKKSNKILFMNIESAELAKHAANCMLASRISFMNMLARSAELVGADIEEIRAGIGSDPRIGEEFLYAGVGYGGSCFPKDVRALISTIKNQKLDVGLLEEVDQINQDQRRWFLNKILRETGEDLKGKNIAIWGLSFKAGTDDVRESPAIYIVSELLKKNACVKVFDPKAMENFKKVLPPERNTRLVYCQDEYSSLIGAEALIILTEWHPFRNPDLAKMKKLMKLPLVFDGRNLLSPEEMRQEGFKYFSVGRGSN